jgi:hypothetical protein
MHAEIGGGDTPRAAAERQRSQLGAPGDTPRLSSWQRAVGLVPPPEVAATFGFRRRMYLWTGLVVCVGGGVSLLGRHVGLAYLEGPAAFVCLAGLCVAFLIYRCPACGRIPSSSLLALPDACSKCGVVLRA